MRRTPALFFSLTLLALGASSACLGAGSDWVTPQPPAVVRDGACWRIGPGTPGDRCSEPVTNVLAPNPPSSGEWDDNHYNAFWVDDERLVPNAPSPRLREGPSGFPGPAEPQMLLNVR